MRTLKRITRGIPGLYLLLILLLMYLPIVVVVAYSFNAQPKGLMWTGFTTEWYPALFQNRQIMASFKNSLIVAGWSCLIAGVIGTLGAVALSRTKIRSAAALETVAMLPIMTPEIALAMAFLVTFSLVGLPSGMLALVLSHATFCIPYILIIVRTRLTGLNPSYEEAARDLGAGPVRAFITVIVPLIAPAILSGVLLAFAMSMDDVIISFFMAGPTSTTFPVYVFGKLKTDVPPTINAMCTVTLGVTFIAVAASQLLRSKGSNT
ncbi:ABC transporter permease [Eubacteriales bacterium OttesenSCG-928-N13]|nr:ABC transporter permease [Eubacteriales bacterium OttesenSCG-928-N13]